MSKPTVELPGNSQSTSDAGRTLGGLLAPELTHFVRGGAVVRVGAELTLRPVKSVELASDFESVAKLVQSTRGVAIPCVCSQSSAALILASQAFKQSLPKLNVVSRSPVLVDRGDRLEVVIGYDAATGILAAGDAPAGMDLEEAITLLSGLLSHFKFASQSDRSRAIAALLTPAFVLGGFLPGRAPIDLGQADSSQTGKGYRNKITAAIYGCVPQAVTQRRSGVGSLEESFDAALVAGHQFISLDNIRGRIDSPSVESFCTEDSYYARTAYSPQTAIDPRRVVVQFTSNKADFVSSDFPNRTSCTRLLKQPTGYRFPSYREGDLLSHVRANQSKYLGAVFTVIQEWARQGRPRSDESRHDFYAWAQIMDWIVRELFGSAPLLDGHKQAQQCMSNPASNWVRDTAIAVARQGRMGELLTATTLLSIVEVDGNVDIPGGGNLMTEADRKAAVIQVGRKLGQAFKSAEDNVLRIDQLTIRRESSKGENGNPTHRYYFSEAIPEQAQNIEQQHVRAAKPARRTTAKAA